jgi:hypothetical protein
MKLKILDTAHHRNGVTGSPFGGPGPARLLNVPVAETPGPLRRPATAPWLRRPRAGTHRRPGALSRILNASSLLACRHVSARACT